MIKLDKSLKEIGLFPVAVSHSYVERQQNFIPKAALE